MDKKNISIIAVIAFYLLMIAIPAADRLSGIFFSPSFSVLSNFYANDFLFYGLILFSGAGVLVGNKSVNVIKGKRWGYIFYFVALFILRIVFNRFSRGLEIGGSDDLRTLGQLFDPWVGAFIYSCVMILGIELFGIFQPQNLQKSAT